MRSSSVERAAVCLVAGVNCAADARVLGTVALPGVALAIFAPPVSPGFRRWIDELPPERLPEVSATIWPGEVGRAVARACDRAATPDGWRLAETCAVMAQAAAEAMGVRLVAFRLGVVRDAECPRWHLDAVRCRLLCTLRGPGTEYGAARPASPEPAAVRQLPTGAAGLFRGLLWPGTEFSAIVHRSPAAPAEPRLLLAIDPVDAAGRA